MPDLAELGLIVDSSQVAKGTQRLNSFTSSGARAERQAGGFSRATEQMQRSMERALAPMRNLQGLFLAIGAGKAVEEIVRLSDEFKNLQSRLKLVSDSQQQFNDLQGKLFALSQQTHSSLSGTVNLYTRMARATKELHTSQADLLTVTKTINEAMQVSGASADEAQRAIIQLSQGMARGVLQGQDLKSVLEQAPRLGQLIAQGMGVAYGSLQKVASEGKVTTQTVIDALLKMHSEVDKEAKSLPSTIGRATTDLKNSIEQTLGQVDTSGISHAIEALGNGIEKLGPYMGDFAKAAEVAAVAVGGKLVAALTASAVATVRQAAADAAMAKELLAESQFAKQAAIAQIQMSAAITDTTRRMAVQAAAAADLRAATTLSNAAMAGTSVAAVAATRAMAGLRAVMAFLGGPWGIAITVIGTAMLLLSDHTDDAKKSMDKFRGSIDDTGNHLTKLTADTKELNKQLDQMAQKVGSLPGPNDKLNKSDLQTLAGNPIAANGQILDNRNAAAGQFHQAEISQKAQDAIKQLQLEQNQLERLSAAQKKGADAVAALNVQLKVEDALRKAGVKSGSEAGKTIAALVTHIQHLKKATEDANKAQSTFVKGLQQQHAALVQELAAAKISADEYDKVKTRIETENKLRQEGIDLSSKQAQQALKLAEANRKLGDQISAVNNVTKDTNKQVDQVAQIYKDTATNIGNAFTQTFEDVFNNGVSSFGNLADRILTAFKSMLAQMATLAIAKPVIIPMVSALGGAMGLGSSQIGSVVGQLGGLGGSGGSLLGSSGLFSGAASGILPFGGIGALTGSLTGGNSLLGGLGGIAGGYGATLLASGSSAIGSTLGATLGSAVPIIGTIIGGALGGAISGLFDNGSFPWARSTLQASGGRIAVTNTGQLDNGPIGQISQAAQQIAQTFNSFLSSTGGTATGGYIGFGKSSGHFLSYTNPGSGRRYLGSGFYAGEQSNIQDPQQAAQAAIGQMLKYINVQFSDRAIQAAFNATRSSGDLNKISGAIDTVKQIEAAIAQIGAPQTNATITALDNLDAQIRQLTASAKSGADAAALLALKTQYYAKTRDAFNKDIGQQILQITDPLQAALNNLDQQQQQRLDVAKRVGANILQVEKLNALEREKVIQQYAQQSSQAIKQITSFLGGLSTSNLSPLSPLQRLTSARQQYQTTLSAAQGGDQTAMSNITNVAQTLLQEGRSYYASSQQYRDLFVQVNKQLGQLAAASGATSQADVVKQLQQNGAQSIKNSTAQLDALTALRAEVAGLRNQNAELIDEVRRLRREQAA